MIYMNRKKIFWGLGFILLALALLFDALGLTVPLESAVGELSLLTLLGTVLFLSCLISSLVKKHFGRAAFSLAFLFMVLEKNISHLCGKGGADLINNWLLLLCTALLSVGLSLLFSGKTHSPHRFHYGIKCNTNANLTASVRYIDASSMQHERAGNNLGALTVRFENAEQYRGGGTLYIENNLGSTTVEVPATWHFTCDVKNNLGSVQADKSRADLSAPLLHITGENNLGAVTVRVV